MGREYGGGSDSFSSSPSEFQRKGAGRFGNKGVRKGKKGGKGESKSDGNEQYEQCIKVIKHFVLNQIGLIILNMNLTSLT